MTSDEIQMIADVLRHRTNEIKKLFEDGGFVPEENVPHVMKAQIMMLAGELEYALYQRDPALEPGIFVDAVGQEIHNNVPKPTGMMERRGRYS